jgi:CelD/BcsL family acetyltransferase involved in cellulose biosynthesis
MSESSVVRAAMGPLGRADAPPAGMNGAAGQAVHVARSPAELERLRPLWEAAGVRGPDADLDYLAAVSASSPDVVRPHVVAIERPGRPPLVAMARLEEGRLELKAGYRVLARPALRTLVVVYGGIAGADSDEDRRLVLSELQRSLREGEADALCLAKLRSNDPLLELARELAPWPCRDHLATEVPRTDVTVPGDLDSFLRERSRNTRDNVRRYGKRLEREHGNALAVHSYREPHELDEALAQMEAVAATTYQRGLGVGFRDEPRQRVPLELAARKGMLRAWVLTIDGTPVAFWYGLAYGGTFYIGSPGYDPAHGKLRVGQYLQMRMMEELCADPAVERLDYGFGDAQYKRSFGDRTWTETDVMIFAARPRPLAINALRTAVGAAATGAKRALGQERVAALKRRARRARTQAA